jgi:uncharacterized protein GlcG (DUF336 family)
MSRFLSLKFVAGLAVLLCASAASAQQAPVPYGLSINLETAKKVAAPALAEARKNNWTMAIAIVDVAGDLIYFEKMDATQSASSEIAVDKARSAVAFKRPTKALQDALVGGGTGMRILGLRGAVPVDGGLPIIVDGKIIGAIGLSGGTSEQDGHCAQIGLNALK